MATNIAVAVIPGMLVGVGLLGTVFMPSVAMMIGVAGGIVVGALVSMRNGREIEEDLSIPDVQ